MREHVGTGAPGGIAAGSQWQRALGDVVAGAARFSLWSLLGSKEIRQRYRRSRLGPLWVTLSMGVTVGALGFVYGALFGQPLEAYLPFLAAGFVVWGLISGLVLDGTKAFTDSDGMILQLAAPLSVHVYRVVWSNLLIFAHNIVVFLIVAAWFGVLPGWHVLYAVAGVAIVLLNGVWLGLFLGTVCARFRDVPQIVASVVQILFFITPILWRPEMLPDRALFLGLNPFYHFVELVRAPLLGGVPEATTLAVVALVTLGGWLVTLMAFARYRWRIAYWV
ncbi:ABC transporter permease [Thiohalocapsa marina]|uniref:Transport permease protein n=1 Tax=Thiohalocapsa marina TaxID=424902 RepID=A0A5M8FU13_9GAMM|nr:ABC transporter permease [Thiohalocapsa marina]KAA6187302.1 ABC transporter permease [Thiohalocapsa marina]